MSPAARVIHGWLGAAERRLGPTGTRVALVLFWGAPLWTGVIGRLVKHSTVFQDYHEIACAAERRLQHVPLYGDAKCAGVVAAPYVYPPWIADVFAPPMALLGRGGLMAIYLTVFVAAVAALIWFALGYPMKARSFSFRVAFLGFIAGGPVAFGNISILVHAGVYAVALAAGADSLLFAATVSLVSLIKPLYLLLFALTVFSPGSLRRKVLLIGAGAVLPLASTMIASPDVLAWRETVMTMMSGRDRGGGFTNVMEIIGVTSLYGQAPLYALYGGILLVSGTVLSAFGNLDREQRVWLGGAIGVLMFPRIMCYDVLALGPGVIAALAAQASSTARDAGRFGGLAMASCAVCFISTIFGGIAHHWRELAYLGLVAVFALCAVDVARGRFVTEGHPEGRRT
jgi:hypothetical protein